MEFYVHNNVPWNVVHILPWFSGNMDAFLAPLVSSRVTGSNYKTSIFVLFLHSVSILWIGMHATYQIIVLYFFIKVIYYITVNIL